MSYVFDELTREADLTEGVKALSDGDFVELLDELKGLPMSGIPVLVAAAVDEDLERRFVRLHEAACEEVEERRFVRLNEAVCEEVGDE